LTDQLHSMTPHHLPFYIAKPGETDVLMIVMGVFLILAVLGVGNIYLRLHSLPERMAHKSQKLQFEIVAVLGLISLFTHIHIFWIAGLLLALIDLPDFSTPLARIAGSVEKIADNESPPAEPSEGETAVAPPSERAAPAASKPASAPAKEVRMSHIKIVGLRASRARNPTQNALSHFFAIGHQVKIIGDTDYLYRLSQMFVGEGRYDFCLEPYRRRLARDMRSVLVADEPVIRSVDPGIKMVVEHQLEGLPCGRDIDRVTLDN
jgi:hypothetical protein